MTYPNDDQAASHRPVCFGNTRAVYNSLIASEIRVKRIGNSGVLARINGKAAVSLAVNFSLADMEAKIM